MRPGEEGVRIKGRKQAKGALWETEDDAWHTLEVSQAQPPAIRKDSRRYTKGNSILRTIPPSTSIRFSCGLWWYNIQLVYESRVEGNLICHPVSLREQQTATIFRDSLLLKHELPQGANNKEQTQTRVPGFGLPQPKGKEEFKGKTLTSQFMKVTRGSSKAGKCLGKKSSPLINGKRSQLISTWL